MKTRKLGSHGPEVSAIGYGAMGIHLAYGPSDEAESLDTIRQAIDLGITFFDTAEMYGWGENEKFLGRAVRGVRDNIVLATKFGFQQTANPYEVAIDSSPENIRKVTENSLRYLGTDRIDLLYQHRPDPEVPVEDVAGAVAELVREGKVLHFGLSEVGEKTIRRAHAVQPVAALQTEYSLFERDVESLFPALRELGVGLVPYCPLGRGFLTGQAKPANEYDQMDIRSFDPRWQPGNYEKNVAAVQNLAAFAEKKGATVAQLALAWLLAQGEDIIPIPGTRNRKRLAENAGAADLALNADDLAETDTILPHGGFGARYIDDFMPDWE